MIESEAERIVELCIGNETEITDEAKIALVEHICDFAESDIAKIEQFQDISTKEGLISTTKLLLSGKIEILRDTGTDDEFSEFERRLTLSTVDEFWMQHIDHMAHLREEVVFE